MISEGAVNQQQHIFNLIEAMVFNNNTTYESSDIVDAVG